MFFPHGIRVLAPFHGTLVKLGMLGLLKADAMLDGFKEADKRAEQKSFVFMTFDVVCRGVWPRRSVWKNRKAAFHSEYHAL